MKDRWAIFLALTALLPVRFAFFRLQSPIIILIFDGENVYFLLMGPPGNLRLALLVLSNVLQMTFSSFRIDLGIFLRKMLPVSSSHIAYTPKDNDTCILHRIHFLMISSCCNRRFYIACSISPICCSVPKLK